MKFRTILADPPYAYRSKKMGGNMTSGSVQKYNTMTMEELIKLPVKDIADKNSVLFLWATVPTMGDPISPLDLMRAWGFKYKTTIFWIKDNKEGTAKLGTGYWYRGNVEMCLFGTRGKIPAYRNSIRNYFFEKPRGHSQKPEGIYRYLTHAENPKIELFCRGEPRDGWYGWGTECTGIHCIKRLINEV